MSLPTGDDADAVSQDADDADAGAEAEWFDRHARIECHRSDRWVRADPRPDDWDTRHNRTER